MLPADMPHEHRGKVAVGCVVVAVSCQSGTADQQKNRGKEAGQPSRLLLSNVFGYCSRRSHQQSGERATDHGCACDLKMPGRSYFAM
jgi:hypothetical protein